MAKNKYDIFISYRRKDTGDKAEHLMDLLEPKYKGRISFDRENLTGLFDVALVQRIDTCKDFLLVVGKKSLEFVNKDFDEEQVKQYNYLATCTQSQFEEKILELGPNAPIDFVRIEIGRALQRKNLKIIPIVPEATESFSFSKLDLPSDIASIKRHEAVFYSDNPDALFKDVVPKIRKHLASKPDSYFRKIVLWVLALAVILACAVYAISVFSDKQRLEVVRKGLMANEINGFVLEWNAATTLNQAEAVNDILNKMEPVEGGRFLMGAGTDVGDAEQCLETPQVKQEVPSFHIGRYEVTISQWYKIHDIPFSKEDGNLPISNVSLDDCIDFCEMLGSLTGLYFDLPTEAEWEFAARGGVDPDGTRYAGSDKPEEVAWYVGNSHKRAHECNAQDSGLYCNSLNLFDMSGNVSEWCLWTDSVHRLYCDMANNETTPDVIYNKGVSIVRGGHFLSDPYELTVYHRETSDRLQKSPNIGLRLIIRK